MRGFTLLELMIAAAVVAITAAFAIPAYRDYAVRGQLVAGTNALLQWRAEWEQYYQDNRGYTTATSFPSTACPSVTAPASGTFTLSCNISSATTYTLTAAGSGSTGGFVYTIDQAANQQTLSQHWGGSTSTTVYNCWITRRGQTC